MVTMVSYGNVLASSLRGHIWEEYAINHGMRRPGDCRPNKDITGLGLSLSLSSIVHVARLVNRPSPRGGLTVTTNPGAT